LAHSTAIVILNYNGVSWLEKFLPVLIANTPEKEAQIWVADNASTDNSLAFVKNKFPSVNTLQLPQNYGFAQGYNLALKSIAAEYYVLLNSDVEVTGAWLTPLIECLQSDETIAGCQPKILSFHHRENFEYAGASGGFIDRFGFPFCRGRMFEICEKDEGQYDDTREVFWASGACLAIKSSAFHNSGGFDAQFFAHMEEIDLCWRLKNWGYKFMVVPQSVVYHVGGGTLPTHNPYKTFLNFRNNRLMLFKNLPTYRLYFTSFIRNFFDLAAFLKAGITGNFPEAKAILKAHWHYIKMVKTYAGMRLVLEEKKKKYAVGNPNEAGFFKGSIVIDYYLKRIQKFSSIKKVF
jgi:hypothetical protein